MSRPVSGLGMDSWSVFGAGLSSSGDDFSGIVGGACRTASEPLLSRSPGRGTSCGNKRREDERRSRTLAVTGVAVETCSRDSVMEESVDGHGREARRPIRGSGGSKLFLLPVLSARLPVRSVRLPVRSIISWSASSSSVVEVLGNSPRQRRIHVSKIRTSSSTSESCSESRSDSDACSESGFWSSFLFWSWSESGSWT